METKTEKQVNISLETCDICGGGIHWGVILVALGLYFLAVDLGWIAGGISFLPIVLILGGAFLLTKGLA